MPVVFNDTIGTSDIGVTVQGYDSDLAAIAGLTTTGTVERTGDGTAATYPVTAAGKELLNDADAATMLATLGAQPLDSDLTAIANLTTTGAIERTGDGTVSTFPVTAAGKELLNDTDAATMLATLGAQPLDSDLTAIAALTTTAYGRGILTAANSSGITVQAGTWTPAYVMSVSGSVTTAAATGIWFRIGKFVFCTGYLSSSALNSPVGNVNVTIPFAAAVGSQCTASIGTSLWNGLSFLDGGLDSSSSTTFILLNKGLPSANYTPVVASDLGSGAFANVIRFSLFYEVAV